MQGKEGLSITELIEVFQDNIVQDTGRLSKELDKLYGESFLSLKLRASELLEAGWFPKMKAVTDHAYTPEDLRTEDIHAIELHPVNKLLDMSALTLFTPDGNIAQYLTYSDHHGNGPHPVLDENTSVPKIVYIESAPTILEVMHSILEAKRLKG